MTYLGGGNDAKIYGRVWKIEKEKEREKGQCYYTRVRCTSRVRIRPTNGLCAGRYLVRLKRSRTRPNDRKIKLALSSWCNNDTMIEYEITGAAHNRVPVLNVSTGRCARLWFIIVMNVIRLFLSVLIFPDQQVFNSEREITFGGPSLSFYPHGYVSGCTFQYKVLLMTFRLLNNYPPPLAR